jgi:putative toxin-antitoxin system antitoxin component (TIGR02293 family)
MIAAIRKGLPLGEFDELRDMLGLTVEVMAAKVGISTATLARRRQAREPLDPSHSDRVVRYARLYWQATEFFDFDEAAAKAWLTRPQRALGDETPLDYADTEAGAREVEHVLGRLETGVYL